MTDPRESTERHDADELHPDGEVEQGPGANDLDADNAVEQDSIETIDPDNAPA